MTKNSCQTVLILQHLLAVKGKKEGKISKRTQPIWGQLE